MGKCALQKISAIIPPLLGYGGAGADQFGVPPNATLYFHISIISVYKDQKKKKMFAQIDQDHGNSDGYLDFSEIRAWYDTQQIQMQHARREGSSQKLPSWKQLESLIKADDCCKEDLSNTAGRSEGLPNGMFHPCALWTKALAR